MRSNASKKIVHFKLKRNIRIKVSVKLFFFFFFNFLRLVGFLFPINKKKKK